MKSRENKVDARHQQQCQKGAGPAIGGGSGRSVTSSVDTEPLFPRLHVKETRNVGPRAPPRNKMALYEQLTVPSHRFASKNAHISSANQVNQSYTSQSYTSESSRHGTKYSVPYYMAPQLPLTIGHHIFGPSGNHGSVMDGELEPRKVPTSGPQDDLESETVSKIMGRSRLATNGKDKLRQKAAGVDDFAVPVLMVDNDSRPNFSRNRQEQADASSSIQAISGASRTEAYRVNDTRDSDDNGKTLLHGRDLDDQEGKNLSTSNSCGSLGDQDNDNDDENNSEPSGRGGDEDNDDSDTSVLDSLSFARVVPKDIIEVAGQKEFWDMRKAILRQQRVFSVQVFELHRVLKVQQLIATSPNLLMEDDIKYLSAAVENYASTTFTTEKALPETSPMEITQNEDNSEKRGMQPQEPEKIFSSSQNPQACNVGPPGFIYAPYPLPSGYAPFPNFGMNQWMGGMQCGSAVYACQPFPAAAVGSYVGPYGPVIASSGQYDMRGAMNLPLYDQQNKQFQNSRYLVPQWTPPVIYRPAAIQDNVIWPRPVLNPASGCSPMSSSQQSGRAVLGTKGVSTAADDGLAFGQSNSTMSDQRTREPIHANLPGPTMQKTDIQKTDMASSLNRNGVSDKKKEVKEVPITRKDINLPGREQSLGNAKTSSFPFISALASRRGLSQSSQQGKVIRVVPRAAVAESAAEILYTIQQERHV